MKKTKSNEFWKVCAALDNRVRIAILRHVMKANGNDCVIEVADDFANKLHIGLSVVSQYLKKLREAGLVSCQRADKRVFYRAFAVKKDGIAVNAAFRDFFDARPSQERISRLLTYVHTLSHERRNAIVRFLAANPRENLETISRATDIPARTCERLIAKLAHAKIVSVELSILPPDGEPEATLLAQTLA